MPSSLENGRKKVETREMMCWVAEMSRFLSRENREGAEMGIGGDEKETFPKKTWGSSWGGWPVPFGNLLTFFTPKSSK